MMRRSLLIVSFVLTGCEKATIADAIPLTTDELAEHSRTLEEAADEAAAIVEADAISEIRKDRAAQVAQDAPSEGVDQRSDSTR